MQLHLIFALSFAAFQEQISLEEGQIPSYVRICLAQAARLDKDPIRIDVATNPYYLRGDFDGDGRTDVSVAITSNRPHTGGMAVCLASKQVFLLGGERRGVWFSDIPGDDLICPWWQVVTRKETLHLLLKDAQRRHLPVQKLLAASPGEVIFMPWQEESAIVYYHRGAFRFYRIVSTKIPRDSLIR